VEILIAPVKNDREDVMELSQGGVAADEEPSPDAQADAVQDHAQLVDAAGYLRLVHALSAP
jgi:hypothetical protein